MPCAQSCIVMTFHLSGDNLVSAERLLSLELVCCKKRQKSPNQETGLGNRGPLEILNDTKLILNDKGSPHAHLGSIWNHSERSDVPYSPNQFLGWDFFAVSYSKLALVHN